MANLIFVVVLFFFTLRVLVFLLLHVFIFHVAQKFFLRNSDLLMRNIDIEVYLCDYVHRNVSHNNHNNNINQNIDKDAQ
jgi:hypothetical protein